MSEPLCQITLPWPPTANHYKDLRIIAPRHGRAFPQWYLTPEAKGYHKLIKDLVWLKKLPRDLAGALSISVVAHPPDNRVRDLDNLTKVVFDSLAQGGVLSDDFQFWDVHLTRGTNRPGGELLVTIDKFHASEVPT